MIRCCSGSPLEFTAVCAICKAKLAATVSPVPVDTWYETGRPVRRETCRTPMQKRWQRCQSCHLQVEGSRVNCCSTKSLIRTSSAQHCSESYVHATTRLTRASLVSTTTCFFPAGWQRQISQAMSSWGAISKSLRELRYLIALSDRCRISYLWHFTMLRI